MDYLTLLLFFVYLLGFGSTARAIINYSSHSKDSDEFVEAILMNLGIGLGVFILVGVILNLLHLSLDWKLFLLLSMAYPVYNLIKNKLLKKVLNKDTSGDILSKFKQLKFSKSNFYILIVLGLFVFTFFMYHQGAFKYQYLEDDDPWEHARSVKYIAVEKTAYEPSYAETDLFRYIDPYPPGYDILMAVLYQTNDSINWTLKFFNALIISMSIIIFYFFVKQLTNNRKKALFATVVLTLIPSYLSHFIWVHSLLPILFMTAFYCLEKISRKKEIGNEEISSRQVGDKNVNENNKDVNENNKNVNEKVNRWWIVAALVIGGIFVTHPEHAIKFVLCFLIYGIVKWSFERKLPWQHIYAVLLGGALSLSWWALKVGSFFQERAGRIADLDAGLVSEKTSIVYKIISFVQNYFQPNLGTATRPYTFNEFFTAQHTNMINNPIGWGVVITLLTIFSVIIVLVMAKKYYLRKTYHPIVTLGWLVLTFLIVNSATFNIPGLFGFRTWLLLALPVAIICAEGFFVLLQLIPQQVKWGRLILVGLVIVGLWYTAGTQKYSVNTAMWPPGASWTSMEDVQLYLWLESNLPKNTKVMDFSGSQNNEVIGMDMDNCDWCAGNIEFRKSFLNKTAAQTYTFLKHEGYEYLILDGGRSVRAFETELGSMENAQKVVSEKFQEYLTAEDKFRGVYQNQGGVVLKVG